MRNHERNLKSVQNKNFLKVDGTSRKKHRIDYKQAREQLLSVYLLNKKKYMCNFKLKKKNTFYI